MDVHGVLEVLSEAWVAYPVALVAHPGSLEVPLEPWKLTLTTLKLTWRPVGTFTASMSLHDYKVSLHASRVRLQSIRVSLHCSRVTLIVPVLASMAPG
jgi:hypothetical protein